jgi:hypothetical protein
LLNIFNLLQHHGSKINNKIWIKTCCPIDQYPYDKMGFLEVCKIMANAFLTANKKNWLFSCWTFLMFWSVVSWSTIPNSNNHGWFRIHFTGVILQFSHTLRIWVYMYSGVKVLFSLCLFRLHWVKWLWLALFLCSLVALFYL